jgi:hypothetical protein
MAQEYPGPGTAGPRETATKGCARFAVPHGEPSGHAR